jgi:hypothetical protein
LTISLRPVLSDDEEFLFSVYVSTRADEMNLVDWHTAQKKAFLRMQFRAQSHAYTENNPGAESNRPVTVYVERFNPAMHLYQRLGFCQVSDQGVFVDEAAALAGGKR